MLRHVLFSPDFPGIFSQCYRTVLTVEDPKPIFIPGTVKRLRWLRKRPAVLSARIEIQSEKITSLGLAGQIKR